CSCSPTGGTSSRAASCWATRDGSAAPRAARGAVPRAPVRGAAARRGDGGGHGDGAAPDGDAHRGAVALGGAAARRGGARAGGGGAVDRRAARAVHGRCAGGGAGARAAVTAAVIGWLVAAARAMPLALVLPIGPATARLVAGAALALAAGAAMEGRNVQQF